MKRRPRPFGRRSLATTVDPLPMNAKPYTRWNIGKKCPFQKNATSSSFKSWPSPFHSFLFPSHRCCVTNELIYARFFFLFFFLLSLLCWLSTFSSTRENLLYYKRHSSKAVAVVSILAIPKISCDTHVCTI